MADGIRFPLRSAEYTPELMTRALATRRPGVVVEEVTVLADAHIGNGAVSTSARAELGFRYAGETDLPERMMMKTVLTNPGAPPSMYENEVRFYDRLRGEVEIETPECYAAVFDEDSGGFGLFLEDVRERGAVFANATMALDGEQIRHALRGLASLHARFWQSPRFATDLDWLWTPQKGGFADTMHGVGYQVIARNIENEAFKQQLVDRLGKSFDELWEYLWKGNAILDAEPSTLLHGDTHLGNTYLLEGQRVGWVDWQLMIRGRWAHDVSYILMTALSIEDRRRSERELLAYYCDELRARGVEAPDAEEAWLLHRQASIWGFVIGWLTCPERNYGAEITHANLERLATALEDLETFEALDRAA